MALETKGDDFSRRDALAFLRKAAATHPVAVVELARAVQEDWPGVTIDDRNVAATAPVRAQSMPGALGRLALLEAAEGHPEPAIAALDAALAMDGSDPYERAVLEVQKIGVLLSLGDPTAAAELLRR
jgi:hypothetical protein